MGPRGHCEWNVHSSGGVFSVSFSFFIYLNVKKNCNTSPEKLQLKALISESDFKYLFL